MKFPLYEGKSAAFSNIYDVERRFVDRSSGSGDDSLMDCKHDSFPLPDLATQRMIASVLSARDLQPNPNALMTLKRAVTIPELGGAISVKALRTAIDKGDLVAIQPGGPSGTVYVTRNDIRAWIRKCRVAPNPHVSISAPRGTKTARSAPARRGSSSTVEKRRALDAALKTARELSKR